MSSTSIARRSLLAGLGTLGACMKFDVLDATVPAAADVTHDIAYGPLPRQKLDVYVPRGAGARPLVVFFYGGNWRSGDKADYAFAGRVLAAMGAVAVVPDYRLYPEAAFPAFLEDCAAATAWSAAHAGQFGAGPVFVMGHSAGAYNAAMLALDPALLAGAGYDRARPAGMIGLAGPYDFLPLTRADIKPIFEVVPDLTVTQPIRYADRNAPPMLLLAGTDDDIVEPRNTVALAAKLAAAGAPVQSQLYPGVGHVGMLLALTPLFAGKAPVREAVASFLARGVPG